MQRSGQHDISETELNSIITLGEEIPVRRSMLYQVLPTVVSSRIPTIPSLRRSISGVRSRGTRRQNNSLTDLPQPETPPPLYTSCPASGSATPNRRSVIYGEADFDFSDDASERPGSSRSAAPPLFAVYEAETGINWRYASQGIGLTTQAYRESSTPIRDMDETSTTLTRQLYVHGMTYLLRGLPSELTSEETLSLQAAIPQDLLDSSTNTKTHALVPVSKRTSVSPEAPPQEATILHRITATLVFQAFVLIQFLFPYIKLLFAHTYKFERKHQITKRLVNTGVTTVDELSRRSLRLSQTVCQMNDGKVGQAINEITLWWIRSVTGGVQQGIEEGLSVVGARYERSRGGVMVEKIG